MSNETQEKNDVISAYTQVKQAIDNLRTEYAELTQKIEIISEELKALPEKPVPFEDLKAGILNLIDTAGERYANACIKPALIDFATGKHLGVHASLDEKVSGKPVKFSQLSDAIEQKLFPMANAKFVQPSNYSPVDDGAYHFFFAAQIKEGISRVLSTLVPADFGYNLIHPDKVGTDRGTRKAEIEAKETELKALYQRRDEISSQMQQLGVQP